jgi:hypothetical protein
MSNYISTGYVSITYAIPATSSSSSDYIILPSGSDSLSEWWDSGYYTNNFSYTYKAQPKKKPRFTVEILEEDIDKV